MTEEVVHSLPLWPERPYVRRSELVSLEKLPKVMYGPAPNAALIDSIRRDGLQEPVSLAEVLDEFVGTKRLMILTGRRRIAAFRYLHREDGGASDSKWAVIPATVVEDVNEAQAAALVVKLHALREENKAAELTALDWLSMASDFSEKEIAEATGLTVRSVQVRLALISRLHPKFFEALRSGGIRESVGEALAKISMAAQEKLAEQYEKTGKLTAKDVREERQVAVGVAMTQLPGVLFDEVPAGIPTGIPNGAVVVKDLTEKIIEAVTDLKEGADIRQAIGGVILRYCGDSGVSVIGNGWGVLIEQQH